MDTEIHNRLKAVIKAYNASRDKTASKMTILIFVNRALEKEIRAYERQLARKAEQNEQI